MEYEYHTLDVFTDRPFAGNPLAVFPEARGLTDEEMQAIAQELNLSETVFVFPPATPEGTRSVRIFTPGREVPFAGHPTVGTAFHLASAGAVELREGDATLVLEEVVGPVPVRVTMRDGRPVSAELTAAGAPREVPLAWEADVTASLVSLPGEAVGMDGGALGVRGRLEPAFASVGLPFLILPLRDLASAEAAVLDNTAWARLLPEGSESRMVYLVAPGGRGEGVDIHVRMFAPDAGVPEDPATGSAAAALGAYLGYRSPEGEWAWSIEQGLEMGRPSRLELSISVQGGCASSVRVGGPSVPMSSGVLTVRR
ncbi:MAG: PhzF family phenazine biosynthesis protein [Gemmatimonadales bacterium]|nr:MAG: PhzF family phenazine biosynthesis protein [Gemmatimonadales bacterium]